MKMRHCSMCTRGFRTAGTLYTHQAKAHQRGPYARSPHAEPKAPTVTRESVMDLLIAERDRLNQAIELLRV